MSRAAAPAVCGALLVLGLASIATQIVDAQSAGTEIAGPTFAADSFVDSVGMNVHLHYDGTLYRDDFNLVKGRLLELGVRHVRDGLIDTEWEGYYERHNELGRAGIRGIFIVQPWTPDHVLREYPVRMADTFEGYEAPNEYNWSGDPDWPVTLRATLGQLRTLKELAMLRHLPVFGPSLTEESAHGRLGDVSAFIDAGNLHNYFSGRHPGTTGWGSDGYGSIDWNLRTLHASAPGLPVVTTETGYHDDPLVRDSVPREIAAKYLPRLLLEQYRKGITRTYLYELSDFPTPHIEHFSGYGLLTSDGTPKPAFTAVKGLLRLLSDPGPPIVVRALDYRIQGATDDLRHMAFQRRDGRYYVALWLETSGYDVPAGRVIDVPPTRVTLTPPASLAAVASLRWGPGGQVAWRSVRRETYAGVLTFEVTDYLMLIELRPSTSAAARRRAPDRVP